VEFAGVRVGGGVEVPPWPDGAAAGAAEVAVSVAGTAVFSGVLVLASVVGSSVAVSVGGGRVSVCVGMRMGAFSVTPLGTASVLEGLEDGFRQALSRRAPAMRQTAISKFFFLGWICIGSSLGIRAMVFFTRFVYRMIIGSFADYSIKLG
jgi:hypothetical protein